MFSFSAENSRALGQDSPEFFSFPVAIPSRKPAMVAADLDDEIPF
jgi:hypothetical protein